MEALIDLSWRAYPGGAMVAVGAGMLVRGIATLIGIVRIAALDRSKPIALVSGLRLALVGMAIAGLGASWIWQQFWLLALPLAIGGEELLEMSFVLYVLRRGQRQEAQRFGAAGGA